VASSLGKAWVEVEANADKVGPEIEARFTAALSTIVAAAEDTFEDVGDESADAARLIAEAFEENGTEAARSLSRVGDAMAETGDRITSGAQQAAAGMTDALRDGANQTDQALAPMVDAAGKAGEKAGDKAGEGFGTKAKVAMAAAGVAAGAALGVALAGAMDVERANDKLAAQLGLTGPRSEEIGRVAGSLYANAYGESLEDVNGAVGAVVSSIAGMRNASAGDIEALTARALDFAGAFDQDVTASANTVGVLIRNGLARDGEQGFDLLTRAFQKVPAAMREELPAILDEYGTNFRALGFTGEQAFGILTGAAEGGAIVLDKVGDSLKELTINGIDLGKNGELYASLGLNAEKMATAIASGGPAAQDATQKIAKALADIDDPAERATAAIQFFGTPLEDLSVDQVPAFLASIAGVGEGMTDAAGAVDGLGTTLNDNAATNLESFKRQAQQTFVDLIGGRALPFVSDLAGTLATQFGPAVQTVGDFLTGTLIPALTSAAGWIGDNQTAILIVAGVIAAVFLPHLVALGIQYTITQAQAVAAWTVQKAQAIAGAATHSLAVLGMIGRWVLLGASAVVQAAIAVGAWVGMGVSAVVQAAIVSGAWLGAQARMAASMAVTVAGVVGGWVLMGAQAMLGAARVAAAWLIAMGPIALVVAAVVGIVVLIVQNWETIKNATAAAFQFVVDKVRGAVDFLVGLFLNFTLVGLIIQHWDTIKRVFSDGVTGAVNFVRDLPGRVVSAIGNLGSLLAGAGGDLIRGFINGISNAAGFVGDVGRNVVNSIVRFINSNVIDRINNLLEFKVGPLTIDPPDLPRIPALAEGAIIRRPTLALVGEDGPEVVLPLSARRAGRRDALMDAAGLTSGGDVAGAGINVTYAPALTVPRTASAAEVAALVGRDFARSVRLGLLDGSLGDLEAAS